VKPGVKPELKRELGFRDLTLFYVVSGLSLRWIATAAASGPSSIAVWLWPGRLLSASGCLRAGDVLALSAGGRPVRLGAEGLWRFAGFMAAWTYWMSNLPYFSAVLYFAAGSAAVCGARGKALANESGYFMSFALIALGGSRC
jgi:hypothetical protein